MGQSASLYETRTLPITPNPAARPRRGLGKGAQPRQFRSMEDTAFDQALIAAVFGQAALLGWADVNIAAAARACST